MGKRNKKQRMYRRRHDWQAHVEYWKKSGLSQADYCRRNDLNPKSFSVMKSRINKPDKSGDSGFIEIPTLPINSDIVNSSLIEFKLEDDFSLSLRMSPKIIQSLRGNDNVSRKS